MPFKRSSSESDNERNQSNYHNMHNSQNKRYYSHQFDENITSNSRLSLTSRSKRERLQREEFQSRIKYNTSQKSMSKYDYYQENQRDEEEINYSSIRNSRATEKIDETKKNERHSHKNKEHSDKREIRKHKKSRDHKDKSKRDSHHSRPKKDNKRRKGIDEEEHEERECSNPPYEYHNDNLHNDSDTNDEVLRTKLLKESTLELETNDNQNHSSIIDKNLELALNNVKEDAEEQRNSSLNQDDDADDEDADDSPHRYSPYNDDHNDQMEDYGHYDDVNESYVNYHNVRSKFESSSLEMSEIEDIHHDSRDVESQSDSSSSSSSYGSSISSSRNPKKRKQKKPIIKEDNVEEKLIFSPVRENEDFVMEVDHRPFYYPAVQGCRLVEEFECLNKIEEGTYGVVFRARDRKTNEIVALKRLKMEKERDGFPITSLREINTLMKARHVNIVTVREIVVGSNMDKIYLVMDFIEHDLKSLMLSMVKPFEICEVKCLMLQLLNAVAHLHDNWILHRDLKTSNLLLSHRGILKVADFGLAREYGSPLKNYTRVVVTLWYRAPELLLGTKIYSTQIDLWSVGCIFGELLLMAALFPGKSEMDQINILFKELGTPNEKIWPGFSVLPNVKRFEFGKYEYNRLSRRFGMQLSESGLELLNRLLAYCPDRRISAEEALRHLYFSETPLAISPEMFPTRPAKSEGGAVVTARASRLGASPKPPSGGGGQAVKCLEDDRFLGLENMYRLPRRI